MAAGRLHRRRQPPGRGARHPDGDRRLDDRGRRHRLLGDDGGRRLCLGPVRTAPPHQFPLRPRQPGDARHLHRDVRLLHHGPADHPVARREPRRRRRRRARVRTASRPDHSHRAGALLDRRPDLLHPPRPDPHSHLQRHPRHRRDPPLGHRGPVSEKHRHWSREPHSGGRRLVAIAGRLSPRCGPPRREGRIRGGRIRRRAATSSFSTRRR